VVWKSIGREEALQLCAEKAQVYRSEPECILHNYGEGDRGCPITPENLIISSPLTGEGKGGGDKIKMESVSYLFTLPFIPSRQGRGNELSDSLDRGILSQAGTLFWGILLINPDEIAWSDH